VSAALISKVTDAVIVQVVEWQSRPLDAVYPIVYLECIMMKIRPDKQVINKAIYLALGVNMDDRKELLSLGLSENEGAKFWLGVLTECQNRGVKDILMACVDGLKGFLRCPQCRFPQHPDTALHCPSGWFGYPEDIRKVIYTPNAIESLNSVIRKALQKRKLFPTDESAKKVVYLAIQMASQKWTIPIKNWKSALNRFMVEFEDRLQDYIELNLMAVTQNYLYPLDYPFLAK
jgi:transposase-like protein